MRTVLGIVKIVDSATVVKLESGLTIPLKRTGFNYGDEVVLQYDFTTKTIKSINPRDKEAEIKEILITPPAENVEQPPIDSSVMEDIDRGLSRPVDGEIEETIQGLQQPEE